MRFKKWRDWQNLCGQHNNSVRHVRSFANWCSFKNTNSATDGKSLSIRGKITAATKNEIEENRLHVKLLFRATCYLGRQGLSFRPHENNEKNKGNYIELLELFAEDNPVLKAKLNKRYDMHYKK